MRDIELKNKEVFIPAELGDDLNISENDDIDFKVIKDGIIIKFHEKKDSLRDMIGIVEAPEPTNAVDLKRKGQRGEY
ncbi:MAG: AbrB/MazE/SpoVT family DNA-binding domain-containing protein [Methanobrevibacter sp.]|jgi:bifunctional DNA-binding transcriptional regulator/antitoxin component of YhaV-PrlF toxin-antitoxin module|nr:AbrB/MazE/SpoVT family DNA-binding domain-containing protein [Methanobrevibacter sp.]